MMHAEGLTDESLAVIDAFKRKMKILKDKRTGLAGYAYYSIAAFSF